MQLKNDPEKALQERAERESIEAARNRVGTALSQRNLRLRDYLGR